MESPEIFRLLIGASVIITCWLAALQGAKLASQWCHWRRLMRLQHRQSRQESQPRPLAHNRIVERKAFGNSR